MKWLILNPDTLVDNNTYYDQHSINLARNKFCYVTQKYCERWGYDYKRDESILFDEFNITPKDRSGWALSTCNKILQVKKYLKDYDYVCMMDTYDTLITNTSLPLDTFINDDDSLFMSRDIYYSEDPFPNNINSGWVIFKNDEIINELLSHYIEIIKEFTHEGDSYNDQNLLIAAYNRMSVKDFVNYDDKLKQSYWFYNSPYGEEILNGDYNRMLKTYYSPYLWKPNDFMIHMCGEPDRFRKLEGFYDVIYKDGKF